MKNNFNRVSPNINKGKQLGISKYLVATSGPQMASESFWKSVKDKGVTDNDFYGVYFPDEEGSPSTLITMHTAMKKYFPNAVAGDYLGDMQTVVMKHLFQAWMFVISLPTRNFILNAHMPGYMVILLPMPLIGKMQEKQYM